MYNADMLASLPRPIIFAHRGASSLAPENTMAAFELAAKDGAPAIELDAKLTRDGKVVIFHDPTLTRTTNAKGNLADRTADELRALDAGSHFSGQYQGEKIPFLEEVLEAFGKKLLINVELRNYWTPRDGLADRVCELLQRHSLQGNILFSSFYAPNLRRAAELLPEVPRALLAIRGWRGAWARSFAFTFGDYLALHPHVADVSPQQVQRVHRLGRRVHVWTVNDLGDITRLAEWGVDGIFTDDPKAALSALGRIL
ncbi:MAG: glycerophosphodiester phosphodiesterase family protein [Chloroflexota bacterium]